MEEGRVKRVSIEKGSSRYDLVRRVMENLPDIPVLGAEDTGENPETENSTMGKETIRLLPYKGEFLKPCPGTKGYICCGYQILNLGTNCPLNCTYCILQAYINQPGLRVFVNLEEGLEQTARRIDSQQDRIFRIGTGEFMDSLAMDPITEWSERLLPFFSLRKNAVLELKTKTAHVRKVLESRYRDRIILSWSLNSPFITANEEKGAAGLKKRLETAGQCQGEGFVLGFHFDPLIIHKGWEEGYLRTLDLMDRYINPKGVIWISLGSFRYMPWLKPIIRKRHPATCVLDGEFVMGLDGKMRYFRPLRSNLYAYIRENLEKWHPNLGLYLCMESDAVWKSSMGWSPGDTLGLSNYLDSRVLGFFG
jgi:spore photoproduct lyase